MRMLNRSFRRIGNKHVRLGPSGRSGRRSGTAAVIPLILVIAGVALNLGCAEDPPPKNLLIFVVDTLRADRLSIYGNPQLTTPNIDAFAREAVVFDNAYAPSPRTAPSHASLFTSTFPATHGVWNWVSLSDGRTVHPTLSSRFQTLAEILRDEGFQTAACADGGWISKSRGFKQGFDHFDSKHRGTEDRVDKALTWLDGRDTNRPFFLFLHTYEVHSPYLPPEGSEDRFAGGYTGPFRQVVADARAYERAHEITEPLAELHKRFFEPHLPMATGEDVEFLLDLYDAELRVVDDEFSRLLSYLEAEELLDDTIIVVTSDHGEEFCEHGGWLHLQVYGEILRIPMIIRDPRWTTGARRDDLVDLVDLMPTVFDLLSIETSVPMVGQKLSLEPKTLAGDRLLIGEVNSAPERQVSVRNSDLVAIFKGDELERVEVYDIRVDPAEQRNIAESDRAKEFLAAARLELDAHYVAAHALRDELDVGPAVMRQRGLTEEQRQELRALGYLR